MNSTTTKVLHRLRRARSLVTRAELMLTGAQILLALGPVGVGIGLVLWIRHRRAEERPGGEAPVPAPATSKLVAGQDL